MSALCGGRAGAQRKGGVRLRRTRHFLANMTVGVCTQQTWAAWQGREYAVSRHTLGSSPQQQGPS